MGQRGFVPFAPFPADLLVWKLLLQTPLSLSEGAEGEKGTIFLHPRLVLRMESPAQALLYQKAFLTPKC